jgi:hypothetical protein
MPLEITVDTKRKKGNETLYLEKDGWTSKTIEKIPELSKPISILKLNTLNRLIIMVILSITIYLRHKSKVSF